MLDVCVNLLYWVSSPGSLIIYHVDAYGCLSVYNSNMSASADAVPAADAAEWGRGMHDYCRPGVPSTLSLSLQSLFAGVQTGEFLLLNTTILAPPSHKTLSISFFVSPTTTGLA